MMMMMIRANPTVQIPAYLEDPTVQHIHSPVSYHSPDASRYETALAALQRYLPSNKDDVDFDLHVDAYSCDEFRMYELKVTKCDRSRSHDWTECPFAHPGEKARRRDPRRYRYSGAACPEFRKAGGCKKGDACEHSHGVFECWLHPARYRTQPCKYGTHCRRRVCFFAHTPEQLRPSSPPSSPGSVSLLVESMRALHLGMGPPAWGTRFGSPPSLMPARAKKSNLLDVWETSEEPVMERVESGRMLREKIYAKLEIENSLDRGVRVGSPDVGWVSDLVM